MEPRVWLIAPGPPSAPNSVIPVGSLAGPTLAVSGSLGGDLAILFAEVSNDAKLGTRSSGWGVGVALLLALGLGHGCYQGGERDKDPPPGLPGGLCLAPDGFCQVGTCNRDENYCFDPASPCEGFFCGGEDRGLCFLDGQGQPACQCEVGFSNAMFPLYCCPDPSSGVFDELCIGGGDESPPASDEGGASTGSG